MKKLITTSVILFLFQIPFGGCGEKPKENIKIGVSLPLSGELANFGKTVLNGVELAVKQSGLENIELIIEDSKGDPKSAVSIINKLTDIDKVKFIIGDLTSGATLAMAPIVQKKKVLLISPTASNPKLSDAGRYFYRVWPSDNYDGEIAAKYSFTNMKINRAAIVYINNDYGQGLADIYEKTFIELGGKILLKESYAQEQTDFRTLIQVLKGFNPELVYIPGHPYGIGTFLKQAYELGLNCRKFSNVAAEDKEFLNIASSLAKGLFFVTPAFDINSNKPHIEKFLNEYEKKYNNIPDIHAVKGFEAMFVLIKGFENEKRTPDTMINFLLKNKFDSISGTFSFNKHGDVISDMAVKKYNENLKIEVVEIVGK
ncbi:MAG: penicillin-binding protein activator [Melioribacteraceae bacterium]|nr:MAG: penicillin-binding protein activator [Melioribacteraceae bacterium]